MQKLIKKVIKYNYYNVQKIDIETNQELKDDIFDINEWLLNYKSAIHNDECIDMLDFKCKIEKNIALFENGRFLIGKIYKLRPEKVLNKIKPNAETDKIQLDDDEYLGEDIMFLYDTHKGNMMVQKNRFSLNVKNLEHLFNLELDKKIICFNPRINTSVIEQIEKGKVTNFKMRVNKIDEIASSGGRSVLGMIDSYRKNHIKTFCVELGIGRNKEAVINKELINEYISELSQIRENVSLARVTMYDMNDRREILDIFDSALYELVEYSIDPRGDIEFEEAKEKMLTRYKAKFDK